MNEWVEIALRDSIVLLARYGRSDLASDLNRVLANLDFEDLDILRTPGADALADTISEIDALPELTGALGDVARLFGVDYLTLHVVSESASSRFSTRVITTYPQEWIARYVEQRYSHSDPVSAACAERQEGFYWTSIFSDSPASRAFHEDALAYGVGPSGYSIPIRTETGDILGLSVASTERPDVFYDRFVRFESDIFAIGCMLADAFCRAMADGRPSSFAPTDDQIMLLRQIGMGATETELQDIEFESGSYADLEKSICDLFQTRTISQAAVLAAKIGLLNKAALTRSDVLVASENLATARIVTAKNQSDPRRRPAVRGMWSDPARADIGRMSNYGS